MHCHKLMNLQQWCELDELIYTSQTEAKMKLNNSKIFMDFFSQPRPLVLGAIEDIAYSQTKNLELELHKTRNEKVSSSKYKFEGSPVNWSTWRQFNSHEKDHTKRKDLFDEFILKTEYIAPIDRDFCL